MTKLGSVPFLNAKPLVYPLETGLVENEFHISYHDPSLLSVKLLNREVDVGLIPVAEFLKRPEYAALPGLSISSYGKVDSVVVLSREEMQSVKTVAVDSRSQSSTALLKIIFEVFIGKTPEYITKVADNNFLDGVDAGMLIGNSGLQAVHSEQNGFKVNDLGEIWTEHTGLPFVYAVFALRKSYDIGKGLDSLLAARDKGLQLIDEIVEKESKNLDISIEHCREYLSERIRYDLDEKKVKGLLEYQKLLLETGRLEHKYEIVFYD